MATESFTSTDNAVLDGPPTGGYSALTGTMRGPSANEGGTVAVGNPERQIAAPDLSGTGIEGEVRRQDINIPKLVVVNDLSAVRKEDDAPLGALYFADSIPIVVPKKGEGKSAEIEIFVLGLKKSYQEKIPYGTSDERPLRADTMAEVRELGGTLDRRDKSLKLFEELAQVLVLIPQPEDVEEHNECMFLHEVNGKSYGKALFFLKSTGYTGAAKPIITRVNNTGGNIIDTVYLLWSSLTKTDTFSYWGPKTRAGRLTTPEEREWLRLKQG